MLMVDPAVLLCYTTTSGATAQSLGQKLGLMGRGYTLFPISVQSFFLPKNSSNNNSNGVICAIRLSFQKVIVMSISTVAHLHGY